MGLDIKNNKQDREWFEKWRADRHKERELKRQGYTLREALDIIYKR
jgi:hypothetical protein